MTGLPAIAAALGYVDTRDQKQAVAGLWLGAALALGCLSLSRIWTLVHDRRHRGASREWWIAHQAVVRRKSAIAAWVGLVVLAGWFATAFISNAWFAAAVLTGPILGILLVLAVLGDVLLQGRARALARRGKARS